jgi:hypothetical protein
MWVMQQPPKQHPVISRSLLFICHGINGFQQSKMTVFRIPLTTVCRDLPHLANGSKTTRFLLRFDYESLPQLAAFCPVLPFQPFFMTECSCQMPSDYRGKSRH